MKQWADLLLLHREVVNPSVVHMRQQGDLGQVQHVPDTLGADREAHS